MAIPLEKKTKKKAIILKNWDDILGFMVWFFKNTIAYTF